jgi:Cu-Zn family superoxide dismutase
MKRICILACSLAVCTVAQAKEVTVDINRISDQGVGDKIGEIAISDSAEGATFKVAVTGLPKGEHGFHVHENGDCGPGEKDGKVAAGLAAGGHFDPAATKSHKGPHGEGHRGDTPKLNATDDGIEQTVTAPKLKLADIAGRSLMIHEGGDNYSDNPENGGGKGRIACGVIPKIQ